jgi:N-acetylmuramic acid 6-phosphate etherase
MTKPESTPHAAADHFLTHERAFRLGVLPTEQSNPKTAGLAETAQRDLPAAIRMLQSVDRDIIPMARRVLAGPEYQRLVAAMRAALEGTGRICFSGCGATGRLSILLEAAWRQFAQDHGHPELEHRVISIMTGGDFALIRSVENFEDYQAFGRQQVREAGLKAGDVLVAISEGGETSSVIGTIWQAVESGAKAFFLFNNPAPVLAKHVERSRQVIEDGRITVLDLACGPMGVAGSTRMQATTSELLVAGAALEESLAQAIGVRQGAKDVVSEFAKLLDDLGRPESVAAMAGMIDYEVQIYQQKGLVTYLADECLLDIFTDTTERSPTFMLPRFRQVGDEVSPPSWAFVKNPRLATVEAWRRVLRREARCLEWDAALYAKLDAPACLRENPPQLGAADMRRFQIGNEVDASRYQASHNTAILVALGEEVERLAKAEDPLRVAFEAAARPFARRAVLAIGRAKGVDLGATCWHVPLGLAGSPLHLWDRLAAKLVLNTVSTATMARMGRLVSNWMAHVEPTNKKLIDRGTRLIAELAGVDYETACHALFETIDRQTRDQKVSEEKPSPVAETIARLKKR